MVKNITEDKPSQAEEKAEYIDKMGSSSSRQNQWKEIHTWINMVYVLCK